jgi:ATP-dependent DNA helicase RecQ
MERGHNRVSAWGSLGEYRPQDVRQWIEQLVGQGFLVKEGEYQILRLTNEGRRLIHGECTPTLLVPATAKDRRVETPTSILDSWEGVDEGLFEELRQLRRAEAMARGVPAYIVFGDAALRDMARRRPSTLERFLDVHGVGRQKAADFGQQFVDSIVRYCGQHGVAMDVVPDAPPLRAPAEVVSPLSADAVASFELFDEGLRVEQAAERLGRAPSTTYEYLETYIRHRRITDASRWIPPRELEQIEVVVQHAGAERLKPIYEALHGRVPYETIRIAVACLANRAQHI